MGDLGWCEPRVDWNHNGAGEHSAEEGQRPVESVAQVDGDPIPSGDASSPKASGHTANLINERFVGDASAADFYDSLGTRIPARAGLKHVADGAGQLSVTKDASSVADHSTTVERSH